MLCVLLVVALATLPSCANAKRITRKNMISVGEQEVLPSSTKEIAPYKYVQQVGLSLYTFPEGFNKAGVQAFYEGIDKSVLQGHGDGSFSVYINNMDDVRQRVTIMQDMMEVAYKSQYYSRDESVLKIFMAPEFFFRGPHGAYDMRNLAGCPEQYQSGNMCDRPVLTILESLSEMVKDAKWKDWVFVFGTIVSFEGNSKYFNFAPVLRGGPGNPIHHIVSKTFVSGIDFLDCPNGIGKHGGFCVKSPPRPPPQHGDPKYDLFSQKQMLGLAKSGFHIQRQNKFTIAGITFGLEVCLDHAAKELAQHPDGVQVHLIVSAGMQIQWTVPKLPGASHNGPVFLQDGGAGGAYTQYYCPGCPYLNTGFWAGRPYNQPSVVQSPLPRESFDTHKNNASRHQLHGRTFSTGPNVEAWYSPGGFATEGAGIGVDPRFARVRIDHIFATDDFKPKINIGPAFEVPSQPAAYQTQPLQQTHHRPKAPVLLPKAAPADQGRDCTCLKKWTAPNFDTCDNACCQPSQDMPFGWCMTLGTCRGEKWKVCASRLEPRVAN